MKNDHVGPLFASMCITVLVVRPTPERIVSETYFEHNWFFGSTSTFQYFRGVLQNGPSQSIHRWQFEDNFSRTTRFPLLAHCLQFRGGTEMVLQTLSPKWFPLFGWGWDWETQLSFPCFPWSAISVSSINSRVLQNHWSFWSFGLLGRDRTTAHVYPHSSKPNILMKSDATSKTEDFLGILQSSFWFVAI